MIFEKVKKHNVRCVLLDSKEDYRPCEDSSCYIEIVIKKNLFRDYVLSDLLSDKEKEKIHEPLTLKEKEILKHVSMGKNNERIAKEMNISVHTTKVHIHNILKKLSVQDRTEAAVKAVLNNWIDLSE